MNPLCGLMAEITLTPTAMLLGVLAVIAGAALVGWLMREDSKLIAARKNAVNVAAFFNQIGATEGADFFEDFAVNDPAGMLQSAESVLKILSNSKLRTATLLNIVSHIIQDLRASGATAEIQQLQAMLAGTPTTALTAAQMQQVVSALNPSLAPTQVSAQQSASGTGSAGGAAE